MVPSDWGRKVSYQQLLGPNAIMAIVPKPFSRVVRLGCHRANEERIADIE